MIEVEIKLPLKKKASLDAVRKQLYSFGFRRHMTIRETDGYFDDARGTIRKNGQALRIREITDLAGGEGQTILTFKGKKLDQVSMTREELETAIRDAQTGKKLLEALGYQIVPPIVKKNREELICPEPEDCMENTPWTGITACLDTVEGLGEFLELESVIPDDGDEKSALNRIEDLLRKLGYSMRDTVTNSYLSMLMGIKD